MNQSDVLKIILLSLVAIFITAPMGCMAKDSVADRARAEFAHEFRLNLSAPYAEILPKAGYSPEEVQGLLDTLAKAYADCNVDFFLSREDEAFDRALELMSDVANKANFQELMGDDFIVLESTMFEHKEELMSCYTASLSALGLPGF